MPFQVLEATESDIPRLMEIQFAAFTQEPADQLFNGANTPLNRQKAGARLLSQMRIDPPLHTIKVVHTEASAATSPDAEPESETVVGFCMWHTYDQPHPEHQWMKEHEMVTCNWLLDASEREKVWTGILPLFTGRMRMEGRPHALLMSMCVDPAWQRRGTERMLMSWGTERCDELGIPAYLDASPFGYPLYRACGFEDYERLVMRIEEGGAYQFFRT